MYQKLTECKTHAENLQISFCFCKTCICLKILENMINRLDIIDGFSVKCVFILHTVIFIDAALNISLRNILKCNVLWFYLFGQGVPNKTKGMINLNWFTYSNSSKFYTGQSVLVFWQYKPILLRHSDSGITCFTCRGSRVRSSAGGKDD